MRAAAQIELFTAVATPLDEGWKIFRAKGGTEVRYLSINDQTIKIDIGAGALPVTRHCQDRWYTQIPGYGPVQERKWKTFMGKVAMAKLVAQEAAKREEAEAREAAAMADAAAARQSEREAVAKLVASTLAPSKDARREKRRGRAPLVNGERKYFNPFQVDWRSTKEFFQMPNWVSQSPLTPIQQIVYSRLLFPLAGAEGFCSRFDKSSGVLFGLNASALAKHLGRESPDYVERVVRSLARECECIELYGSQGQTKDVRFIVTGWMSPAWIALCDQASAKTAEASPSTSAKTAEAPPLTSAHLAEVPSVQRKSENEAEEKAPATTFEEWVRVEALRAYAGWTEDQLRRQWNRYRAKGEKGNKWDASLSHFLSQWMPKAKPPDSEPDLRSQNPPDPEPPDWKEFVGDYFRTSPKRPKWSDACQKHSGLKGDLKEWRRKRSGEQPQQS